MTAETTVMPGSKTRSDEITGGCLCGAVRFAFAGPPAPAAYCHCSDCRRTTGSAFNLSLPAELAGFRIVAGAPKGFTKQADSGMPLTRHFCPDCGAPLFTSSPAHPDRVYVKAGALDDPAAVVPVWQSWLRSAVPWAHIPADLPGSARDRG